MAKEFKFEDHAEPRLYVVEGHESDLDEQSVVRIPPVDMTDFWDGDWFLETQDGPVPVERMDR